MRFLILLITLSLTACGTIDRGSFGDFKRSLNNTSYGYEIIEDFTGQAPTERIEKFEVRPGDCSRGPKSWSDCANSRERSELSQRGNNYPGSEWWYGWSIYVPNNYPNVYPAKTALGQFHQRNGPPAFMFQNYVGGYWVDRNFGSTTHKKKIISAKDFKGRWHQIEVNAKWHTKDGFFRVHVNGDKAWQFEGQTLNKSAVYFKYGVYRSFISRYTLMNGVNTVPTQTVYFANVKRSKTREGLQAE